VLLITYQTIRQTQKITILKEKALASIYKLHLNFTERTTILRGNALLSNYQTIR
jgi:hypothetical protein